MRWQSGSGRARRRPRAAPGATSRGRHQWYVVVTWLVAPGAADAEDRRRTRRGTRPAPPRPRRARTDRATAPVPHARRPQQHRLQQPRGRRCWATSTALRTCRPTRLPPALRICPSYPRPTSRSGRPRPSGTRMWPMPMRSGGPVAKPNCTYGTVPSTVSTPSHHEQLSARTPATPVPAGFGASSHSPMRAADLPAEHQTPEQLTALVSLPRRASRVPPPTTWSGGGATKVTRACTTVPTDPTQHRAARRPGPRPGRAGCGRNESSSGRWESLSAGADGGLSSSNATHG